MSHTPSDEAPEDAELVSRSDERRARKAVEEALVRLARDLVRISDKSLEKLGLPEEVVDLVRDTRAISSPRARERQLRTLRNGLRDLAWPALRARLDTLFLHGVAPERELSADEAPERAWVVRLVGERDRGIDALLAEHPELDRRHLRDLVRAAGRGSPEARKRAEEKLAHTLRMVLRRAPR